MNAPVQSLGVLIAALLLAVPLGCDGPEGAADKLDDEAIPKAYGGDQIIPKSAKPGPDPMAGAPKLDVPSNKDLPGNAVKDADDFAHNRPLAEVGKDDAGTQEADRVGPTVHDIAISDTDGAEISLGDYAGRTLLIVNTASECGFTPQYTGLQALYDTYGSRGLEVLAFPSNDFGGQEPGTNAEIQTFCQTKFGVEFPVFAKVHAKGPDIEPLYAYLTQQTPEGIRGEVKWNFTKFLVAPDGRVVARFESKVTPSDAALIQAIEANLPRG